MVRLEPVDAVEVPGRKAIHRLALAFPDAFIRPSVGTVLRF